MRMMKNNNNETVMVIGIDHGYGNMKTATRCFPSGVARYDKEPIFQNMGKVAVGNMVVTVDGGENFAISGGTNTFYYDSLWAGYSLTQTVPMQEYARLHHLPNELSS